jgi:hypothetical protein
VTALMEGVFPVGVGPLGLPPPQAARTASIAIAGACFNSRNRLGPVAGWGAMQSSIVPGLGRVVQEQRRVSQ